MLSASLCLALFIGGSASGQQLSDSSQHAPQPKMNAAELADLAFERKHQRAEAHRLAKQVPKLKAALAEHPHDGVAAAKLTIYYSDLNPDDLKQDDQIRKIAPVVDAYAPRNTATGEDALNLVCDYYGRSGRCDDAIRLSNEVINARFPAQTALARIHLSECYQQTGQYENLVSDLQAYLRMDPKAAFNRKWAKWALEQAKNLLATSSNSQSGPKQL